MSHKGTLVWTRSLHAGRWETICRIVSMELSINSVSYISIKPYIYVLYTPYTSKSGSSLTGLWLNNSIRFLIRR